jgi:hypothetical protein
MIAQPCRPDLGFDVTKCLEQTRAWRYNEAINCAEERLLNPPPGGRIEAARDHGIDLSLLVERLRKTPEERVRDLQCAAVDLEAVRGKVGRRAGVRK